MNLFFDCLSTLHQLTLNLAAHPDRFQCRICQQSDQFVSHGYVYKKQHHGEPIQVGKRLLCATRRQHHGCGATLRLSVAEVLPDRQYTAPTLQCFILCLLAGASIAAAYRQVTGTQEPRHAYRWLRTLLAGLSRYRAFLAQPAAQDVTPFSTRCRRLRLLLPTLDALRIRGSESFAAHWQYHQQTPFMG